MITNILTTSLHNFLKLYPIILVAIVISHLISHRLTKKHRHIHLKNNTNNITRATIIGILTPGPLIGYLPLLKTLRDKGLSTPIIASFITGQTLIGPIRLFIEVALFGWAFFLARVLSALLTGQLIGLTFSLTSKSK